jgi:ribosomal protein L37AE/L43A
VSFDSIPEDREPTYPCDCGGSMARNFVSGAWECDSCGFVRGMPDKESANEYSGEKK